MTVIKDLRINKNERVERDEIVDDSGVVLEEIKKWNSYYTLVENIKIFYIGMLRFPLIMESRVKTFFNKLYINLWLERIIFIRLATRG